jgi:DNA-binding response OmpR family regulator
VTSLLVVDDDRELASALQRDLERRGLEILRAHDSAQALTHLRLAPVDVCLFGLPLHELRWLLSRSDRNLAAGRCVLMSAMLDAQGRRAVVELGCHELLKPFTPAQLMTLIRQLSEESFSAVEVRSLVDVLQAAHRRMHTERLTFPSAPHAEIVLRGGEVIHAVHGDEQGEAALLAILRSRHRPSLEPSRGSAQRTIDKPFMPLILDLLARLDAGEPTAPR